LAKEQEYQEKLDAQKMDKEAQEALDSVSNAQIQAALHVANARNAAALKKKTHDDEELGAELPAAAPGDGANSAINSGNAVEDASSSAADVEAEAEIAATIAAAAPPAPPVVPPATDDVAEGGKSEEDMADPAAAATHAPPTMFGRTLTINTDVPHSSEDAVEGGKSAEATADPADRVTQVSAGEKVGQAATAEESQQAQESVPGEREDGPQITKSQHLVAL